jgi:hypothetical protein
MASTWLPPAATDSATTGEIEDVIWEANSGQAIKDPLGTGNCYDTTAHSDAGTSTCVYNYYTCSSGTGYAITALFESTANTASYADNSSGTEVGTWAEYDIGSCPLDASTAPSAALPLNAAHT